MTQRHCIPQPEIADFFASDIFHFSCRTLTVCQQLLLSQLTLILFREMVTLADCRSPQTLHWGSRGTPMGRMWLWYQIYCLPHVGEKVMTDVCGPRPSSSARRWGRTRPSEKCSTKVFVATFMRKVVAWCGTNTGPSNPIILLNWPLKTMYFGKNIESRMSRITLMIVQSFSLH